MKRCVYCVHYATLHTLWCTLHTLCHTTCTMVYSAYTTVYTTVYSTYTTVYTTYTNVQYIHYCLHKINLCTAQQTNKQRSFVQLAAVRSPCEVNIDLCMYATSRNWQVLTSCKIIRCIVLTYATPQYTRLYSTCTAYHDAVQRTLHTLLLLHCYTTMYTTYTTATHRCYATTYTTTYTTYTTAPHHSSSASYTMHYATLHTLRRSR